MGAGQDLAVSRVDHPGQLVEIAWPIVGLKGGRGLRSESAAMRTHPLVSALQKMLGQEYQVVSAVAKRSEPENQRGDREEKCRVELLILECGLRIARSEDQEPSAAIVGFGEASLEVPGQTQDVTEQQARSRRSSGLRAPGILSPVGIQGKGDIFRLGRPRKKLVLENLRGQRLAVEALEGPVRCIAEVVNGPGHMPSAGSRLTDDQHRNGGRGRELDLLQEPVVGGAGTDQG